MNPQAQQQLLDQIGGAIDTAQLGGHGSAPAVAVIVIGPDQLRAALTDRKQDNLGIASIGESGPAATFTVYQMLTDEAIRDTNEHLPAELADLNQATAWFYVVDNKLDEGVSVILVGDVTNNNQSPAELDLSGPVSAGRRTIFLPSGAASPNPWTLFQGVKVKAPVAPTAGLLSVICVVQNGP